MSAVRFEQIYRQKQMEQGGYNVGGCHGGGLTKAQLRKKLSEMTVQELKELRDSLGTCPGACVGMKKVDLISDIVDAHNLKYDLGFKIPTRQRGRINMMATEPMPYEVEGVIGQPMAFEIVKPKKPRKRVMKKNVVMLADGSNAKPMAFKIVKPKAKKAVKPKVKKAVKPKVKKAVKPKVKKVMLPKQGRCKAYKPGPKCKVNKNGACPSKLQLAAAKVNPWLRFMAKFRKESKLKGAEALAQGAMIYKQLKASGKLDNYLRLPYQGLRQCAKK